MRGGGNGSVDVELHFKLAFFSSCMMVSHTWIES